MCRVSANSTKFIMLSWGRAAMWTHLKLPFSSRKPQPWTCHRTWHTMEASVAMTQKLPWWHCSLEKVMLGALPWKNSTKPTGEASSPWPTTPMTQLYFLMLKEKVIFSAESDLQSSLSQKCQTSCTWPGLAFLKVRRSTGVGNEYNEFCTTCCQLLFLVPACWVTTQAKWLHWVCNSCQWKRRGRRNSLDKWGAGRQQAHKRLILVCIAWPCTLPSNTVLAWLCTNAY